MIRLIHIVGILACLFSNFSCQYKATTSHASGTIDSASCYTNPLLSIGGPAFGALFHNGMYYYIRGVDDKICLWALKDITEITHEPTKTIWPVDDSQSYSHIWDPQIHYINGKWYVYFSMDDGDSDNRQLHVLENASPDPLEGEFVLKGKISTDPHNNLAIYGHPFVHKGKLYLLWSGWKNKRIFEEMQCLYIAEMSDPWTLASERVLISEPKYEWECQWVGTDGNKAAYPVYVNEMPFLFHSRDKDKLLVYYSASANWTPYHCIGLLVTSADSDPLSPASWTKLSEPVFRQSPENNAYAPGNICFVPSPDYKEWYMLYLVRNSLHDMLMVDSRSLRMQPIGWDEEGLPLLGKPAKEGEVFRKPSGL